MLQRRGNQFISRIVIPIRLQPLLGRVEITRSLRTSDRREALRRLALWETHVGRFLTTIHRQGTGMTREQLDQLRDRYLVATFDEIEERLTLDWCETALDVHRWDLAEEAEVLTGGLANIDYGIGLPWARSMLPQADEDVLRQLARRLMEAKLEAIKAELNVLAGEPLRMPLLLRSSPPAAAATPASQRQEPTPLLSEVVARYSEERLSRKTWSARTAGQYREIYGVLVDLLGNPEVGAVTKEDVRQLGLSLVRFPSNAKKVYPNQRPSEALMRAGDDEKVARLAPASVNMYQQAARSLFQWAADHDLIRRSPATVLRDIKAGSAKDDRLPFSDDDLKAYFTVLETERQARPWLYWIPRIMAFTGCRLGEAAQLCKEDIRQEGGVWVFDINENHPDKQLKTASSVRLVPIHPRLKEMGLLQIVSGMPSGFLWPAEMRKAPQPERSPVDKLQRLLATRLRAAGVKHARKTAAHSFRHTLSARLKGHSVPEYQIAEILGHEHDSLTTNRYGATTNVEALHQTLSLLTLPI